MRTEEKQELTILDRRHFLHPTSSVSEQQQIGPRHIFVSGEGIYLKDVDGNVYIDALSSLWNVNVGHGRKELAEAAREQMEKLAFSSSFSTFSHEPAIRLAEKIASLTTGDLNVCFFTSGGSEANDSAFKLVRHYWILQGERQRKIIISQKKAYHGVSVGATNATGITEFREMADWLTPDVVHIESPAGKSLEDAVSKMEEAICHHDPKKIAAFVAEPVQGAGGVLFPPPGYFREIRRICDKYGILLIADEVITGFGRTGKMFALEHEAVIPDMMTVAKGITSGYIPLGAVVMTDRLFEVFKQKLKGTLFHGFTYSGHPTACHVALKNIEIIEKERLVQNARQRGEEMLASLQKFKKEFPFIRDVRVIGLLGAVEFHPQSFKSNPATAMLKELEKRKVICRAITYDGTATVAVAPPLVIKREELEKLTNRMHEALSVLASRQ